MSMHLVIPAIGATLLVLIFVYSLVVFRFVEHLFYTFLPQRHWTKLLLAALNAGAVYLFSFNEASSMPACYAFIYALMFAEMWLLYRESLGKLFFVVGTICMHMMALHTICCVAIALINGQSLYIAANSKFYYLLTALCSTSLLIVATLAFKRVFSLSKTRSVLQHKPQRRSITYWITLCDLYLLYDSKIFALNLTADYAYLDQIIKCVVLVTGAYILLVYNFKVGDMLGYKDENESLAQALNISKNYLGALVQNAKCQCEVNVTQNRFLSSAERPDGTLIEAGKPFAESVFVFSQEFVEEEYRQCFIDTLNADRLLREYRLGNTRFSIDYRVMFGGVPMWNRMNLNLVMEKPGADLKAFIIVTGIEYEKELLSKAERDSLTGLLNRAAFESRTQEAMQNGMGILLMMDVDNFKCVNDTVGHGKGDEVLQAVAANLQAVFRKEDYIGRFGGDEFMVFARDTTDVKAMHIKLEQLQKEQMTITIPKLSQKLKITLSIGAAVVTKSGLSFAQVYKQADEALYATKIKGKAGYSFYSKNIQKRRILPDLADLTQVTHHNVQRMP